MQTRSTIKVAKISK